MDDTPSNPAPQRRHGIASALEELAMTHPGPRLSLGALLDSLGNQGFGLMVLLLALPNMVPGPIIPGFSLPFAIGIIALGVQMIAGREQPSLPRWSLRWSLTLERFRRFVAYIDPRLRHVERRIRERPGWLTTRAGGRLIGAVLILLSLVLILPVPLGNMPIACSIGIIALGLLEEDARALAWALAAGGLSTLWNAVIIFAGAEIFEILRTYF